MAELRGWRTLRLPPTTKEGFDRPISWSCLYKGTQRDPGVVVLRSWYSTTYRSWDEAVRAGATRKGMFTCLVWLPGEDGGWVVPSGKGLERLVEALAEATDVSGWVKQVNQILSCDELAGMNPPQGRELRELFRPVLRKASRRRR